MEEDNKLIATFMGWSYSKSGMTTRIGKGQKKFSISLKDIQYYTSWDWLMPVVEKIESLSISGKDLDVYSDTERECEWQFTVVIQNGGCTIDRDVLPQYAGTEEDFLNLYSCLKTDKVKSTYEAVIEFIKWYNNQSEDGRK